MFDQELKSLFSWLLLGALAIVAYTYVAANTMMMGSDTRSSVKSLVTYEVYLHTNQSTQR